MLMNWSREFELLLVEDTRFEKGKSRFSQGKAFFYEGKEIAHFHKEGVDIRLTASGIYAMQARLAQDSVLKVAKDWVLLRLESEEDLNLAKEVLERAIREAHNALPGPKGKQTRRGSVKPRKSEALRPFEIAKALKELEDLDPGGEKKKRK